MIITIDGPTASGKSTAARLLAEQLSFMHINSGLLYRALAYVLYNDIAEHHKNMNITIFETILAEDHAYLGIQNVEKICKKFTYTFTAGRGSDIIFNGKSITHLLKTPEIDQAASIASTHASTRQALLDYQRTLANDYNIIADGRDCGTVVFPHADYKFFLTASLDVRVARHQGSTLYQGKALDPFKSHLSFEQAKKAVAERDARDSHRSLAPLKPAPDGYIIDSSNMTVQEVIDEMTNIISSSTSGIRSLL